MIQLLSLVCSVIILTTCAPSISVPHLRRGSQQENTSLAPPGAWQISAYDYPDPQDQPGLCRPLTRKTGFLCDPDGVLTQDDAQKLDDLIQESREQTFCACSPCSPDNDEKRRFATMVAIVRRLQVSRRATVLEWSKNVRQKWASNARRRRECPEFSVIGLVTEYRGIGGSVSPAGETHVTLECLIDIETKTWQTFRSGQWTDGLRNTVRLLSNALSGGVCGTYRGPNVGLITGTVVAALAGFGILSVLACFCMAFLLRWACIADTCFGKYIGAFLLSTQRCVNTFLVRVCLEGCGLQDCCEYTEQPLHCVPDTRGKKPTEKVEGGEGETATTQL